MDYKIEIWPIEKLVFYARNPRKNDAAVDRMCASIREFGFKIPVLARSDGEVVEGHLRRIVFRAAARLVNANSDLRKRLRLLESTKRILRSDGGGSYAVLSADGDVQDGIRQSLLLRRDGTQPGAGSGPQDSGHHRVLVNSDAGDGDWLRAAESPPRREPGGPCGAGNRSLLRDLVGALSGLALRGLDLAAVLLGGGGDEAADAVSLPLGGLHDLGKRGAFGASDH